MNATEAKTLAINSKSSATTALVTAIDTAITTAASRGNNKLCTKEIVSSYGTDVVMEAYAQLRTLGYKVNPLTGTVSWV